MPLQSFQPWNQTVWTPAVQFSKPRIGSWKSDRVNGPLQIWTSLKCLCIEIFYNFFIGLWKTIENRKYRLLISVFVPEIWAFKVSEILRKMRKENWAFCAPLTKIVTSQVGLTLIQYLNQMSFRRYWLESNKTWYTYETRWEELQISNILLPW